MVKKKVILEAVTVVAAVLFVLVAVPVSGATPPSYSVVDQGK
jgi:hypothetical protein